MTPLTKIFEAKKVPLSTLVPIGAEGRPLSDQEKSSLANVRFKYVLYATMGMTLPSAEYMKLKDEAESGASMAFRDALELNKKHGVAIELYEDRPDTGREERPVLVLDRERKAVWGAYIGKSQMAADRR